MGKTYQGTCLLDKHTTKKKRALALQSDAAAELAIFKHSNAPAVAVVEQVESFGLVSVLFMQSKQCFSFALGLVAKASRGLLNLGKVHVLRWLSGVGLARYE